MSHNYTVTIEDSQGEYSYRRENRLAEREVIDLGEGLQVIVDAIESEPTPGQPGRIRARRHYNIVHDAS